jgi:hypothetical protein
VWLPGADSKRQFLWPPRALEVLSFRRQRNVPSAAILAGGLFLRFAAGCTYTATGSLFEAELEVEAPPFFRDRAIKG